MAALILLMSIQFICRLAYQTVLGAVASTIFLLFFVVVCYYWGGWASVKSVSSWFGERQQVAFVVALGVFGVIGLMIYDGRLPAPAIVAEAIGAYFVFHGFTAAGDQLMRRFRKRRQ